MLVKRGTPGFGTPVECDPIHTLLPRVCSSNWLVGRYRYRYRYRGVLVLCSEFVSQCIRHSKDTFCRRESGCCVGISRVRLVCGVLCHLFGLVT